MLVEMTDEIREKLPALFDSMSDEDSINLNCGGERYRYQRMPIEYAFMKDGEIVGYAGFCLDEQNDYTHHWHWANFNGSPFCMARDIERLLKKEIEAHHRMIWYAISSNPATKIYDKWIRLFGGQKTVMRECVKTDKGWDDIYNYEVLRSEYKWH